MKRRRGKNYFFLLLSLENCGKLSTFAKCKFYTFFITQKKNTLDTLLIDKIMSDWESLIDPNAKGAILERIGMLPTETNTNYYEELSKIEMKNPNHTLVYSLLMGPLGGDRFYLGFYFSAVWKMLTCGGLGIWAIVDMFYAKSFTRERNAWAILEKLEELGGKAQKEDDTSNTN